AVGALRVLQTFEVSAEPSTATDIRWAGDSSIYLARIYDGVVEVQLKPGLPAVRQVVPSREKLGVRNYRAVSRLAVSDGYLAWGESNALVAWRSLAHRADGKVRFERKAMAYAEDLDLAGDRLLILGTIWQDPAEYENFSPDGAVAYLGSARET